MLETSVKTVSTDMRTLLRDAQDLFHEATSSSGVKAAELRDHGLELLQDAMNQAQSLQNALTAAGRGMDDYVRRNPWQALVAGVGAGVLLGLLFARRSPESEFD